MSDDNDNFNPDWFRIPAIMRPALERYIVTGTAPGTFLDAVLCNDLKRAVLSADTQNIMGLRALVVFLVKQAPPQCFGSPKAVANWTYVGGIKGRRAMRDEYGAIVAGRWTP